MIQNVVEMRRSVDLLVSRTGSRRTCSTPGGVGARGPHSERARDDGGAAAPIHYVGAAAPAVLLLQNGRLDQGTSADSGVRWNEAGSQPKRIKWYDAATG